MSIKGLELAADVENETKDVLGGGGFTLDTDAYPMIVDMAYLGKSTGGAMNVNLHLKKAEGGNQVYRHTIYVTSGDKKGNKNFYTNQQGTKITLPGYSLCDLISQICAGKNLATLDSEEKTIKLWDFDAKEEVPTKVPALTELIGQPILVGIQKIRENKRANDGTGNWVNTNESREINEIVKVFYPDGFTVAEKAAEAEVPAFIDKWKAQNGPDYVKDKFKAVKNPVGAVSADALPAEAAEATANLFED